MKKLLIALSIILSSAGAMAASVSAYDSKVHARCYSLATTAGNVSELHIAVHKSLAKQNLNDLQIGYEMGFVQGAISVPASTNKAYTIKDYAIQQYKMSCNK